MTTRRFPPTLTGWMLAAAVLLALLLSLLTPLNVALWDALNRSLPTAPDPRVVVVGIDDQTLRDCNFPPSSSAPPICMVE